MIGGLLFGNRLTSEQFDGSMIGVCLIMDVITLTLMQKTYVPQCLKISFGMLLE
jgi:hypothetical protein